MSQKRVSVRLVAEGGRQVKAEFQGIGDAGESSFRRIERQADITGAVVRRVMGVLGAAISTRQLVAYADQWTDLRSRVDLATGSQEAGAAVMDRLAAMARRTYSSLGQTTESWPRQCHGPARTGADDGGIAGFHRGAEQRHARLGRAGRARGFGAE